jgi:hypothetical protein
MVAADDVPPKTMRYTTSYTNVVESALAVGHQLTVKWRDKYHIYKVLGTRVHANRRYMDVEIEYVSTLTKEGW